MAKEGLGAVYISGMTAATSDCMDKFKTAEKMLEWWGYKVVNPDHVRDYMRKPWEEYLKDSLELLMQADAIYMIRGWRKSREAVLEHTIAKELNMEVIISL